MFEAIGRTLANGRGRTVREKLQFLIDVSALISVGFIAYIVEYKLDLLAYFPSYSSWASVESWSKFLAQKWGPALLSATTLFWLLAWRHAYSRDFSIAETLFTPARQPVELSDAGTLRSAAGIAILFNATFIAMAWFIDNPVLYTIGLLLISSVGLVSTSMTRSNLSAILNDARYVPAPDDEHKQVIEERREVVKQFVFRRPQMLRQAIGVAIAGTGCTAAILHWLGSLPSWPAYLCVGLVVFANEVPITFWRFHRDAALSSIDDAEIEAATQRQRGQAMTPQSAIRERAPDT